ncbi:MAG: hypothetical protein JSS79_08170 [Bacteroidetes bacterium]|nr:hypothetical protein [Bacteroidota bacterium]
MQNRKTILRNALLVGSIPALLEGILIYVVEPTVASWLLLQAVLFWFSCGFIVHLIEVGLPALLHGIVFTVFMNIPWYIAESIGKNKPEHLLPLIIASVVMGIVIGFVSGKLKKNVKNKIN